MALPMRPSLLPQCSQCVRRFTNIFLTQPSPSPSPIQKRYKSAKKALKNNTHGPIHVRLSLDMPTFGRSGSIVPVSRGQMRNTWLPKRQAVYLTPEELKDCKERNVPMERDFEFQAEELRRAKAKRRGRELPEVEELEAEARLGEGSGKDVGDSVRKIERRGREMEVQRVTPERSMELLTILLPTRFDFYRQVIEQPAPEKETQQQEDKQRQQQQRRAAGAAGDLLAARANKPSNQMRQADAGPKPIYGSIHVSDIASAAKAALSINEEASKVAIEESDIKFIAVKDDEGKVGDADRVKYLGDFEVEIKIKGAEEGLRKPVRVHAQEGEARTGQ